MDLKDLKSHAFDCITNMEMWRAELQKTQQMIANYKEEPKPEKEEKKVAEVKRK
jgi:hypothetical protein